MRIAFIIPSLENKGPIVFTKYLVEGLKNKVDFIKIFYFKSYPTELDFEVDTQKINFFDNIDFEQFDIVHSTMLKPDLYCLYRKNKIKYKMVVSIHNYIKQDLNFLYSPLKAFLYEKIWFMALKQFNYIVVSSYDMFSYYKKKLNKEGVIIPYGINKKKLNIISKENDLLLTSLRKKYMIIGSCGLLIKRKGFQQLIEFLKEHKNYALVIIGDGEEKQHLMSLINLYKLNDRAFLLGFKDNSIDYYKYFDIYVMSSFSEGFGLAMLEAMSQKLPLVCSDLPIYKDYFKDNKVSLFSPNKNDVTSLSRAINEVVNNIENYKIESFNLFIKEFSLKAMCEKHIELYKKIQRNISDLEL